MFPFMYHQDIKIEVVLEPTRKTFSENVLIEWITNQPEANTFGAPAPVMGE